MEIDDKVDGDKAFELEDTSTTEVAPTPIATLDSKMCQKLIYFPTTKVSLSRTSVKSACMEKMLLLGNMDDRMLMIKPENTHDYHTYECKHCGCLMKLPWKVEGSHKNEGGGGGSCHTPCIVRYLEKHCNEAGRNFIE